MSPPASAPGWRLERDRGAWRAWLTPARAAIGALMFVMAFVTGPLVVAGAAGGGRADPRAGLAQSWTTVSGTWAIVPMGHLQGRTNTFWQVLFEPSGSNRWRLVTPEGVATNGGLSADAAPGNEPGVVVGIQPSINLRFSPLAITEDGGAHWRPGVLGSSLKAVADAIAEEPDGQALALSSKGHGTLERSSGTTLTHWTTVTSSAKLAASGAGRTCKVQALTAVTVRLASAGGTPDGAGTAVDGHTAELGAQCQARGVVGIFEDADGTWDLVGPRLGARAHPR